MRRTIIALSGWLLAPAAFAILDTNNNGLSDLWEMQHNSGALLPASFDPQADADSDGWTNAQEEEAGTNPFVPNPPDGILRPHPDHFPAVWSEPDEYGEVYVITPETVTVTWPTLPGKQYTLFFSDDLSQGSWLPVGNPFIAYGGESEYGFDIEGVLRSFWRVTVEDVDSDADGLNNHEESLAGTNAYGADSDFDTISDLDELIAGINPLKQDSDGDGIPDPHDAQPAVNDLIFADADNDGIPDIHDAAPNNARGAAPSIITENAIGNPFANLIEGQIVEFAFTVSNPAGPAPTALDVTFYLNGIQTLATITPLGNPVGSTQSFVLTWTAETTPDYPSLTIQNLKLRFRDAAMATSWLDLAEIDVAEWEGKVITIPFVSSEDSWSYEVVTHQNGLKSNQPFVARNEGANLLYRGPKTMTVIDSNGGTSQLQLPDVAIPYWKISGSPGNAPTVVEQLDYATLATGMDVDFMFNNGSDKSIKFDLSAGPINATLNPGETHSDSISLDNVALPLSTPVTISYLDQSNWTPFYSSVWPVTVAANANSRILRSTNVLNSSTGQLQRHSVPVFMERDVKITPHGQGSLEYPGLPMDSVTSSFDEKYMPIGLEKWRKIHIKVYPPQEHFTYSRGYQLNLSSGSTGNTAPQAGWIMQMKSGGSLSSVTIPPDGKIEITDPASALYQQITSQAGLVLFIKRGATVDQLHNISLDILPKIETNSAVRLGELSLLPVDIRVLQEGTAAAPQDGLVVKKTDTVRYRMSPGLLDSPMLFENDIQWHWRILRWDGYYEDWTPFQNGKGHTFTVQPASAGIYEIKATVFGEDFYFMRQIDDIHSTKKKGENDCFGVADEQWQIDVRNTAKADLGSTAYAKAVENSPFKAGSWKCNQFVGDKATDGGAAVPKINGNNPLRPHYPFANQWSGTEPKPIPSWVLLPRETYPQPGWVITRGVVGGTGHTGIIDYDGSWINAGQFDVNRKADLRAPYYNDEDPSTPEEPARFRKYNP